MPARPFCDRLPYSRDFQDGKACKIELRFWFLKESVSEFEGWLRFFQLPPGQLDFGQVCSTFEIDCFWHVPGSGKFPLVQKCQSVTNFATPCQVATVLTLG